MGKYVCYYETNPEKLKNPEIRISRSLKKNTFTYIRKTGKKSGLVWKKSKNYSGKIINLPD